MLKIFEEFRGKLDTVMIQAMHKRIVLYGYGYTGRFLKWYAEYYHSIVVDYIISMDMRGSQAYDREIFRYTLFDFDYKDVKDAVVWLAEPYDEDVMRIMEQNGYQKNKTFFDFYELIYGKDIYCESDIKDAFFLIKTGKRDIQFFEWLEWKYQCNFVTAIENTEFEVAKEEASSYRISTQKEIFPILDKCHCIPTAGDAIFDYGCGKGGALISFLDYGFQHVGGVEYEPKIFEVLVDNMRKLGLDNMNIECFKGDAAEINMELDKYNWFYFYYPFGNNVFTKCLEAICQSLKRKDRKVHLISFGPRNFNILEETGIFRLTNQFTIDTRQRVVDVFENY